MRAVIIVGDGMVDRPLRELNYKTPLEAASLKSMDQFASAGASGLLDPIAPGVAPGAMLQTEVKKGRREELWDA